MSSANRIINDAINRITGSHKIDPVYFGDATIESVDLPNCVCSVTIIDGHTEVIIPNVRLMSVIDDGVIFEPVIGSTVTIIYSQNVDPVVVKYSQIKSIQAITNKFIFNDGSNGGLAIIGALLQKINNLENQLNSVTTWAATVTPPLTVQPLVLTQRKEIENTLIIHGV